MHNLVCRKEHAFIQPADERAVIALCGNATCWRYLLSSRGRNEEIGCLRELAAEFEFAKCSIGLNEAKEIIRMAESRLNRSSFSPDIKLDFAWGFLSIVVALAEEND